MRFWCLSSELSANPVSRVCVSDGHGAACQQTQATPWVSDGVGPSSSAGSPSGQAEDNECLSSGGGRRPELRHWAACASHSAWHQSSDRPTSGARTCSLLWGFNLKSVIVFGFFIQMFCSSKWQHKPQRVTSPSQISTQGVLWKKNK